MGQKMSGRYHTVDGTEYYTQEFKDGPCSVEASELDAIIQDGGHVDLSAKGESRD